MLSYSVQPTPFRWIVTGVPAGPDIGDMLTTLVSTTKYVRASVVPPERIDTECLPPWSSGTSSGRSRCPSPPMVVFFSSTSFGAKPLPDTRLPSCVPQTIATCALAGRPRALSVARDRTGPCAGAMLTTPSSLDASDAGTGCFWYGSAYADGAMRPGVRREVK